MRETAAELKDKEQVVRQGDDANAENRGKDRHRPLAVQVRDAQGRLNGFLAVISDISKRCKAEIDLKNQILFSRQIFHRSRR